MKKAASVGEALIVNVNGRKAEKGCTLELSVPIQFTDEDGKLIEGTEFKLTMNGGGERYKIYVAFGPSSRIGNKSIEDVGKIEGEDFTYKTYEFNTLEEVQGFAKGLDVSCGWLDLTVFSNLDIKCKEVMVYNESLINEYDAKHGITVKDKMKRKIVDMDKGFKSAILREMKKVRL